MKIIKVSTNLVLSVHEFTTGNDTNEVLQQLIGNGCEIYEHVMPVRLYTELNHFNRPTKKPGQCVSMLIDEEGLVKKGMEPNLIGCYMYQSEKHGHPIMGNILFVGEKWTSDGIDFCGIEEKTFETLKDQLLKLIKIYKKVQRRDTI